VEGALVHAIETGLVAVHQAEAGVGGGSVKATVMRSTSSPGAELWRGSHKCGVRGPRRGACASWQRHFLNEIELEGIGGLEAVAVVGDEGFEGGGGLVSMTMQRPRGRG